MNTKKTRIPPAKLKDLNGELFFIEKKKIIRPEICDYSPDGSLEMEQLKEHFEVYGEPINNNVIIANYSSLLNDEGYSEFPKDILKSVSNGTTEFPYKYLIDTLNNNKNILVYWSKIYGTTSDYDIYYDALKDKPYDEIEILPYFNFLCDHFKNGLKRHSENKYRLIQNGKVYALDLQYMEAHGYGFLKS